MDLSTRVASVLRLDPNAHAISQDGRWDTWGDLTRLGDNLSAVMSSLRDLPQDGYLALVSRNDTATVATLLWALSEARPLLLLNNMQPDAALSAEITELRPAVIAAVQTDWDRPGVLDAARGIGAAAVRLERGPAASATVLAAAEPGRDLAGTETAPGCAVSLKTSGTTGTPKRIEITRSALSASIEAVDRHHNKKGSGDAVALRTGVTIQMLPLAHSSAIQSICVTVAAGRRLALLERFEPIAWSKAVRDHQVVTTGVPPAALRMILDADIDPSWLASLRAARAGSAPLDPALAEEFENRFDVAVLQAYGATEMQGLASWTLKDHKRLSKIKKGAVGRLHPGVEVRVIDQATEAELPVGSVGLLEVRTAQAVGAGDAADWIRTSDLARYDEDGFLWIVGRADGAINRGGFKIDPGELAALLRSHPAIADAVVVGLPDPRLGQVPVAAVEPSPGAEPPEEAELAGWLRERVEAYKVPRVIEVVDTLPRTVALKPDGQAVRALLAERLSTPGPAVALQRSE
ncbi:hypothetical protein GCM10010472_02190 [Pseudonocardia halophobica]|uniref:Acyl-CoA synthetase (AMP-forming)/AMP-acid ligase II n=1 Tax=Pseudonocardia halophobica TaxID=29401 RepID=A0A9W6NV74_9PSEU|nr:fatty acid--CoA ligase family protein [Pseudonocardia halophobica]GLL10559.1 hypothetical protein GCM10017577_16990 [Pseudonocardia halophobica]